jgi:hypothetical protein
MEYFRSSHFNWFDSLFRSVSLFRCISQFTDSISTPHFSHSLNILGLHILNVGFSLSWIVFKLFLVFRCLDQSNALNSILHFRILFYNCLALLINVFCLLDEHPKPQAWLYITFFTQFNILDWFNVWSGSFSRRFLLFRW